MLFVVNVIILNDLRAGVSNIRRADQNRPTRGSILMNIMGVPNHDKDRASFVAPQEQNSDVKMPFFFIYTNFFSAVLH